MTPTCPRNGAPLTTRYHAGTPYHACGQCEGLWLPLDMVPELTPLMDVIVTRANHWPNSTLACPSCRCPLHVAKHEGIEIDLCRHCRAVWLDRGELDKIVRQRAIGQTRQEAEAEVANAVVDSLSSTDSGVLDWLGEALGQTLGDALGNVL